MKWIPLQKGIIFIGSAALSTSHALHGMRILHMSMILRRPFVIDGEEIDELPFFLLKRAERIWTILPRIATMATENFSVLPLKGGNFL